MQKEGTGRPQGFRGRLRNQLLAALPGADLEHLRPHLVFAQIKRGAVLQDFESPPKQVHFIQSGLASLLVQSAHDSPVEIGLVGRTGLIGASTALGAQHVPVRAVMLVAGDALTMDPALLKAAVDRSPHLLQVLLNAMQVSALESAQLVLCNIRHDGSQRVARWLLMARERLNGNQIPVTHDVIGRSLGMRRASVTDALGCLVRAGAVETGRACITVLNTNVLQRISCDCNRAISSKLVEIMEAGRAGA